MAGPAFLAWLVVIKLALVGWSVQYAICELGLGALVIGLLSPLSRGTTGQRAVSGIVLSLLAWMHVLAYAVLAKTGSPLDVGVVTELAGRLDEFGSVLASEIRWYDVALLAAPLAFPILAIRYPLQVPAVELGAAGALVLVGSLLLLGPARDGRNRPLLASWVTTMFDHGDDSLAADWSQLLPEPEHLREAWAKRPKAAQRPNVIVGFLESVRASATSLYGPHLPTTPFLAELGTRSVVYEQAHVIVPGTSKSLLSTMCGYPPEFRIGMSEPGRLPAPALPELLAGLGYRAAFVETSTEVFEDHRLLFEELGFGDYFSKETIYPHETGTNYFGLDDEKLIEPILGWLEKSRDKPFFLSFINLNTHQNYVVPDSWPTREYPIADPPPFADDFQRYLNAIAYADSVLRRLFERLKSGGWLDNTVVILLGDHGQAFGEHGRRYHAGCVWEEGTHIPLLVHGPESIVGRPRRVGGLRSNLDVFYTVADIVGVPGARVHEHPALGVSLLAAPDPGRKLYSVSMDGSDLVSSLQGTDKRIALPGQGRIERYDIASDPLERNDLGSSDAEPDYQDLLDFRRAVNSWYAEAERRKRGGHKRRTVPRVEHEVGAELAGVLRLVGVSGKREVTLNHHEPYEFVFEVLARPRADHRLGFSTVQLGRRCAAVLTPELGLIDVGDWNVGDVIVLTARLGFVENRLQPGTVSLRVELHGENGRTEIAECEALRVRVD